MESLRKRLAEKGFRLTVQRESVLKAVRNADGEHLTVEEIYDRTRRICPEIGIATVYRTMQLLSEIGVVTKEYLDDTVVRYEMQAPGDEHSHPHMVCQSCGRITEADDDLTAGMEQMLLERYGFTVRDHKLRFSGICADCRNKGA